MQNALAALERVSALYDIVPEESGKGSVIEHLRGEVELQNVSFSYTEDDAVLEDVSCHVQPGEHIAIVGPSGVGKTTLISLLLRFYQPTRGDILFDGQLADSYELHSLRNRIGYVSQSSLLLSGSILENLRYGNEEATLEKVIQACKVSGIHETIINMKDGYDSLIGENGVNLSEGQRQRLSIARAVIKNPDIIILDEPTSALDSIVEKSIFDSLPKLLREKTMFVVAHRLATIQNSDRILLLNEKKLVAIGTHKSLLETNEFYRTLVSNQQIFSFPADGK
jgi:ABC-type multidrug transport system fused ATPase/permease subunit